MFPKYFTSTASLLLLALVVAGCSKSGAPPQALPAEQVAPSLEKAFQSAGPEAKSAANEVAVAVRNNDDVKAMGELQDLTSRPELTPEQRDVAARSMVTVMERLHDAAGKGNKGAAEALEVYRAHK